LKTTIGSRLSMHSEIAVASITLRPCSSTCRYEMRRTASRSADHRIGVVDPVDLRRLQITSALISMARSAAAVSVLK
jgi:hypothetical protein